MKSKRKFKKTLSLALSAIMAFGAIPMVSLTASAAESTSEETGNSPTVPTEIKITGEIAPGYGESSNVLAVGSSSVFGDKKELYVRYDNDDNDLYYGDVTWVSSDESVVTVEEDFDSDSACAVVTAVESGDATVTATTTDGSTADYEVKVLDESMQSGGELSIENGGSKKYIVLSVFGYTDDYEVTSDNEDIAYAQYDYYRVAEYDVGHYIQYLNIYAVSPGTTTITAVSEECGSVNYTVTVGNNDDDSSGLPTILSADVDTASDDCVLLGLEGEYISEAREALDLINQYRLEACQEGVVNPSTGEPLTEDDYVPIKWSSDLEYIAGIRAAESDVIGSHQRLNKKGWNSVLSPNGVKSDGEVIAWNSTYTMTQGIKQWCSEKWSYVNNVADAETGHYEQIINPKVTYVGLASFYRDGRNTTVGEFLRTGSDLDETQGESSGACIQLLDVSKSYVTGYSLNVSESMSVGDISYCYMMAEVYADATREMYVTSGVAWTSSNTDVATVDSSGKVTAVGVGTAEIIASANGEAVACEVTVSVKDTQNDVPKGDVNGDGTIDISDATMIQKGVAQIITLTDEQQFAADVNGDGTIDITDATMIQKFVAKIITSFTTVK